MNTTLKDRAIERDYEIVLCYCYSGDHCNNVDLEGIKSTKKNTVESYWYCKIQEWQKISN